MCEIFQSIKLFKQKFLRQYPICVDSVFGRRLYYIPDFYCHKAKLVVEADGPIHLLKKEYDKNRDEVLKALNLTILRFDNDSARALRSSVRSGGADRILEENSGVIDGKP